MGIINTNKANLLAFVKRLVSLNTVFGTRAVKLAGINDSNNFIEGNFQFIAPNQIVFPGAAPPEWLTNGSGPGKVFRITEGGGPNSTALFRYESHIGNVVTVADSGVQNFTGSAKADGRIWATVDDPKIARATSTGATMYNVNNRSETSVPGDTSEVALALAEHYHEVEIPRIIMHRRNHIGEIPVLPGNCSGIALPIGPFNVVDRCGNVIMTRNKPKPTHNCFPSVRKCPGETCKR